MVLIFISHKLVHIVNMSPSFDIIISAEEDNLSFHNEKSVSPIKFLMNKQLALVAKYMLQRNGCEMVRIDANLITAAKINANLIMAAKY